MLMAPAFEMLPQGSGRWLMRGWAALAVASLALAGLFAVLLVLSRMPVVSEMVPWPAAFFEKGLVAHVALSFAVWFLAVLACFAQWAAASSPVGGRTRRLGEAGLALAVTGTVAIVTPAFFDGEPTLNNYIPVIIDPVFYGGLVLFGLGILIAVLRMLTAFARAPNLLGAGTPLIMTAGILFVASMAGFLLAAWRLDGVPVDHDFNERLMWGGGHMLQFVNLAMMLTAWGLLAETMAAGPLAGLRLNRWAAGLAFAGGLAGIGFFGIFDIQTGEFLQAFTDLQYALAPPALLFFGAAAWAGWRRRDAIDWTGVAGLSLISSVILFAVGGAFGLFVDGADTRTPAHYHGVIGGINLAFVGLFYTRFLPLAGRDAGSAKLASWQIIIYAVGQLLFVAGMFAAGGMGQARKVAGVGFDPDTAAGKLAAGIQSGGGGLAIIGGVLFIYIAARALLGGNKTSGPEQKGDAETPSQSVG